MFSLPEVRIAEDEHSGQINRLDSDIFTELPGICLREPVPRPPIGDHRLFGRFVLAFCFHDGERTGSTFAERTGRVDLRPTCPAGLAPN